MKTFRNLCVGAFCSFLFYLSAGCSSQSYPANTPIPRSGYPSAIERAKKSKWYMVLHSGINVYSINAVQLDRAKKQATVQLDKVDSAYLSGSGGVAAGAGNAARQPAMHLYTSDSTSYTLDEPHTIMLEKIARIERVD